MAAEFKRPAISGLMQMFPFADLETINQQPILTHKTVESFMKTFINKPGTIVMSFLGNDPTKYELERRYEYKQYAALDEDGVVHTFTFNPGFGDDKDLTLDTRLQEKLTEERNYLFDGYVSIGFKGRPIVHFETWKTEDHNLVRNRQSNWAKIIKPLISEYGISNFSITYQETPDGNCIVNCLDIKHNICYSVTLYGKEGKKFGMTLSEVLNRYDEKLAIYVQDRTGDAELAIDYHNRPIASSINS